MADAIDIETIGVAFDTSGLEKGTAALKQNEQAAVSAANAADKVSASNTKVANTATQMMAAYEAAQRSAKQQEQINNTLAASQDKLTLGQVYFLERLKETAATYGMSKSAMLEYQAAQLGVTQAAQPMIDKLKAAESAAHNLSLANAGVTRELAIMGGEAIRGNWTRLEGSMTVLANRTGLLQAAIAGIASPIGLVTAGILALGAAVVAGGVYYEHHITQLAGLEAQLTATGRASMLTRDDLDSMVRSLDTLPGVSRDAAVGMVAAFTRQYQIGHDLMQSLVADVGDFAAATGKTAPEAAKELAQAFSDPARGARELHDQLGILSEAEVLQIKRMQEMGDVTGAQDKLLEALHGRILGLANEAVGPLGNAMKELREAWVGVTDSVGDNKTLQAANTILVGIVESATWLVQHKSDVESFFESVARTIPAMSVMLTIRDLVNTVKPNGVQTGSAGGSWSPSTGDIDRTKQWIDQVTKANEQYKTQAFALDELKQRQQALLSAWDVAGEKYGENSAQAKQLKVELDGVTEAIARARPNTDALSAAMERYKQGIKAAQDESKLLVAHIQGEFKQGLINEVQAIDQERDAKLAAITTTVNLLYQELSLAKTQKDRQAILGQISEVQNEYTATVQSAAIAEANYYATIDAAARKADQHAIDARVKTILAINQRVAAMQLELDGTDKLNEAETRLELQRLQRALDMPELTEAERSLIQLQIDGLTNVIALTDQLNAKRLANKQAAEVERAWTSTDKHIEDGLYNAITNGGHNAVKQLLKDMENWFARLVLQPIIQPIGQFGASLLNPSAASAAGNIGSSVAGLFNGGSTWSLSNVGTMGQGLAGFAGFAPSATTAATDAFALSDSVYGGSTLAAGGGALSGALGAIGTAMPYIGVALLAAQALGLFNHGGPKTESGYGSGVPLRGDPSQATQIGQGIQQQYASYANLFGLKSSTLDNFGVFLATDPQGTAQTQLQVQGGSYQRSALYGGNFENVGRSDADLQKAISLASAQLIVKNLQEQVSGPVGDYLKSINITTASLDDLTKALQVATDVGTFDKAVSAFGPTFSNLTSLTVDAKEQLVQAAGGVQNFTTELSSYWNDYATSAEKSDAILQQLTSTFQAANVVLPTSAQGFKDAVNAAMAAGNTTTLQLLLSSEGAFKQLYGAIQDTGSAAASLAASIPQNILALSTPVSEFENAAKQAAQQWNSTVAQINAGNLSNTVAQREQDLAQAQSALSKAEADAQAQLQKTIDTNNAYIDSLQKVRDAVAAMVAQTDSVATRYSNASLGLNGLTAANAGDRVNAFMQASQANSGSRIELLRDAAYANSVLGGQQSQLAYANATAKAPSVAPYQLAVLAAQGRLGIAQLNQQTFGADHSLPGISKMYEDFYTGLFNQTGMSSDDFKKWAWTNLNTNVGDIGVPQYASGTDRVRGDQLALIHDGERITPAAYNRSDATNAQIVQELRSARAAHEESKKAAQDAAKAMKSLESFMRQLSPEGKSIRVTSEA